MNTTAHELQKCEKCREHIRRLENDGSTDENRDDEYRPDFARDRDRLLYSPAFRRLAGVAQIATVGEQRLLHNRLTHSLKVAQLGRRLAERTLHPKFGIPALSCDAGIYPDIVETAGLAHDIGHPPFGHIGESVLSECMGDFGGFEGNAQSFRIVTKLASRVYNPPGVNLTRGSLNAILKYPRLASQPPPNAAWTDRSHGNKWGVYESERREFAHARAGSQDQVRSACAILMDWADDVSYATHDIEDYFRAGLVPLQDLERDKVKFLESARMRLIEVEGFIGFDEFRFADQFGQLMAQDRLPLQRYEDTRIGRAELNMLISKMIKEFVRAVEPSTTPPYVSIKEDAQYKVQALKEMTWYYVINYPPLGLIQEGQKTIIRRLFEILSEQLEKNPSSPRLPQALRSSYEDFQTETGDGRRARAVCDFICQLTEDQALDVYERMTGISRSSIFGTWFHT